MGIKGRSVKGVDKRRYPRYPLLIQGSAEAMSLAGSGPFRVVASNISLGGMVLHTRERGDLLQPEDVLKMVFGAPLDGSPVELHARVVWKRPLLENLLGTWTFGVLFLNMPETRVRLLHDPAKAAATSKLLPEKFAEVPVK